ncbi:06518d5b-dcff-4606-a949-3939cd54e71a [Sclerotinia trifoliorum]|uniref:06518d5b-dcff-4606-a949-3939cd54e71a n=1 Tax=Sclerotinia trifoliorum TaxID=28548 RepID=A0A8H2ZRP7_9HELO|nr:06518d5b-dcff-4606-a949-3939cd54e71a [Sclerotinia trifoliorum]
MPYPQYWNSIYVFCIKSSAATLHAPLSTMEEGNPKPKRRDAIRDRLEFESACHPGVDVKELTHFVHNTVVSGTYVDNLNYWPAKGNILCRNCGIDTSRAGLGYTSRIKLYYVKDNDAIWELGGPDGQWLLRDELNIPGIAMKTDYTTQEFLREANSGVPLVEMYRFGGKDDKFNFTMMSRAKGKMLGDAAEDLCDEQLADLEHDYRRVFKIISQFTSPYMQRVGGAEALDTCIGNCKNYGCIKTGRTEEEWLENLTPGMRKSLLLNSWWDNRRGLKDPAVRGAWVKKADEKIAELKAKFPRGGPYVLTHGDFNGSNLFASNDNAERKWKVTAVIDWETASYLPWWVGLHDIFGLSVREHAELWECFPPGFTLDDWEALVKTIREIKKLWIGGGYHGQSKHGLADGANHWFGPDFCECRKIRQHFLEWHMGWSKEHLDVFDPELTDTDDDDDAIDDNKHKHGKHEREFQRWFKEISI